MCLCPKELSHLRGRPSPRPLLQASQTHSYDSRPSTRGLGVSAQGSLGPGVCDLFPWSAGSSEGGFIVRLVHLVLGPCLDGLGSSDAIQVLACPRLHCLNCGHRVYGNLVFALGGREGNFYWWGAVSNWQSQAKLRLCFVFLNIYKKPWMFCLIKTC